MFSVSYELTSVSGSGVSSTQPVLESEIAAKVMAHFNDNYQQFVIGMDKVFRRTLFEGIIYLLRRTPVVTGRLRGSFCAYFRRHGKMEAAERVADRPPISGGSKSAKFDRGEFEAGVNQGFVEEQPFDVVIGSNVSYGPGVEMRHAFLAQTIAYLAQRFNMNTEAFIKLALEKGYIPTPSDDPGVGES